MLDLESSRLREYILKPACLILFVPSAKSTILRQSAAVRSCGFFSWCFCAASDIQACFSSYSFVQLGPVSFCSFYSLFLCLHFMQMPG